ncbi:unnamed protein product, partial [Choristocarpus tenellus]
QHCKYSRSAHQKLPQAGHVTTVASALSFSSQPILDVGGISVTSEMCCSILTYCWHTSAIQHYSNSPRVLNVSSRRVRIPGYVENEPLMSITVDTATDIPVISLRYIEAHPTLCKAQIREIPAGALNYKGAGGRPLYVTGFIQFTLQLGDTAMPVQAVVIPNLGVD